MQYPLLIYENEKRFSKGFPEAELAEYRAFGKQFATCRVLHSRMQGSGRSHRMGQADSDHVQRP